MSKSAKTTHAIPFGWHIQSHQMVQATEVSRGRACGCVCASCGVRLLAKQGDVRVEHFAHDEETDCRHAPEAAIHQMAKQLIAERASVFVPERTIVRKIVSKRRVWTEALAVTVQPSGIQQLAGCEIEKAVFGAAKNGELRRPDVLALLDGKPLAVEIRNTHAVDDTKLVWLKAQGYSVLEISVGDLSLLPLGEIPKALERRLFETSAHSVWLSHTGDTAAQQNLDGQEQQARLRLADQELAMIAAQDAEEAKCKQEAEFRERVRDLEDFKLRIRQSTLRVGLNATRVSLKIHGYASGSVFAAVKAIAHKHYGQFNRRARHWEFSRPNQSAEFFRRLCVELKSTDWQGILLGRDVGRSSPPAATDARTETSASPRGRRFFANSALEEAFQERAGILEFDAGYSQTEAEQLAREEITGLLLERCFPAGAHNFSGEQA